MTTNLPSQLSNSAKAGRIFLGRGASEFGGFAIFFGCTAFMDKMFPSETKWLKGFVARNIMSHCLPACDSIADVLKAVEGKEKAEIRKTMTPEQKAVYFADYLVDYGIKVPVSWMGMFKLQKYLFPKLGVREPSGKENGLSMLVDEVPKLGTIYYFNVHAHQKLEEHRHSIANILHSTTGMSKDRADTYAADTINVVVPNVVGLLASGAYLCYELLGAKGKAK